MVADVRFRPLEVFAAALLVAAVWVIGLGVLAMPIAFPAGGSVGH